MKRFSALLIALVMMLSMVPAMAEEVTGTAKGAVQIDAVGLDIQSIDALPQEYGAVYKFHQKSSSSMTAARFSGVRVSASRRS